jgi:hypothetical protein
MVENLVKGRYQTTESGMNVMNILIDFLSSSVSVREDERKMSQPKSSATVTHPLVLADEQRPLRPLRSLRSLHSLISTSSTLR